MEHQRIEQNRDVVRRLYEDCIGGGDLALLDQLIAPSFAGANGQGGAAGFRTSIEGLRRAFPDIHYTLDDIVAQGDLVAVRWHWEGTFTAPFRAYAPTGERVSDTGMGIFELHDGAITASWLETNRLAFLQQIGVVPPDEELARRSR